MKSRRLFVIFTLIICAFLFGCGEKSGLPSQENAEMAENKLQDTVSVSENFETKETESKKQKDNLEKKNDESNQQKIESEKNDEPILENIDLNKYITVITSGVDGCGELHAFLDRESFYLDYMDAIKFKNSSAERTFYSLYTQCENKNPTEAFFFFIDNGLSTIEYNLKNGDVVELKWKLDEEKINDYFSLEYIYSNQKIVVEGLKEPYLFDPFDYITVSFDGNSPWGTVKVETKELNNSDFEEKFLCSDIQCACNWWDFTVDKSYGLRNGDEITINYTPQNTKTVDGKVEKPMGITGILPTTYTKTFTVEGLPWYPEKICDIDESIFDEIDSYCEGRMYDDTDLFHNFDQLQINDISRTECFYWTPIHGEGEYQLTVAYEVDATVRFDHGGCSYTENSYYEDWTYFVAVNCTNIKCEKDGEVNYSRISSGKGLIYETNYLIDGEIYQEHQNRYDIHQEEYSFSTDGYWTISEVESELQFNPSLYHLERKTF